MTNFLHRFLVVGDVCEVYKLIERKINSYAFKNSERVTVNSRALIYNVVFVVFSCSVIMLQKVLLNSATTKIIH